MPQKSSEFTDLQREYLALKSSHEALEAKVKNMESLDSTNGDTAALLQAKDAEISQLKAKSDDMIQKFSRLEGEATFWKRKAETMIAQVQSEKEDEIARLKIMFTEVSEKRKESFLQLKDRLKQASEMLTKTQETKRSDDARIEELQRRLDTVTRQLADKTAEVAEASERLHALEHERGDLFARTSAELQKSRNDLRESEGKFETLMKDYERTQQKMKQLEDADAFAETVSMTITPSGQLENGRAMTLTHSHPSPAQCQVQWSRSFGGSAFTKIPGGLAQQLSYTPTIDDVGATLKVDLYMPDPLAPDAMLPKPVSREIGPVRVRRNMVIAMHEAIKKGDILLNVESAYDSGLSAKEKEKQRPQILLNREKIKLRAGGKTIAKAEWSDQLRVVIDYESTTRFTLRVDASSTPVSYSVPPGERDLIVQTIRSFNAHMLSQANAKAGRTPVTPPDAILALAYLIVAANKAASRAPTNGASDRPLHLRQTSESHMSGGGMGHTPKLSVDDAMMGGLGGGSHPNTPARNAAVDSLAPFNLPARHPTNAEIQFTSGATTTSAVGATSSTTTVAAASSSSAAASEPVAVGKIQGSNGEELEIDADGFVIRRDTGWGPSATPAKVKKAKKSEVGDGDGEGGGGGGDDSDFSDDDDEDEFGKPAIQMKINDESRPIATGADLRKSICELQLPTVGGGGDKKKNSKGDKHKSKKSKKSASGIDGVAALNSPDAGEDNNNDDDANDRVGEPSPSADATSASAAYAATAAGSSSSAMADAGTGADKMNPDDFFAFLDSESSKRALPQLGDSTPMAPAASSVPSPMTSRKSSLTTAAPPSVASIPGPVASTASAGLPQLQRTPSVGEDVVDILVMETIHARVLDGDIIEYAVWGEILLHMVTPPTTSRRFDFQLFNTNHMTKIAPNNDLVTQGGGGGGGDSSGVWIATIPSGTSQPLCVMKYKVSTDLGAAKSQVPLQLKVDWKCSKEQTIVDVDYSLQPESKMALADLKFLIGQSISIDVRKWIVN